MAIYTGGFGNRGNPATTTQMEWYTEPGTGAYRQRPTSPTRTFSDRGGPQTQANPSYVPAGMYRGAGNTQAQWAPTQGMTREQFHSSKPQGSSQSAQTNQERVGPGSTTYYSSPQYAADLGAWSNYGRQYFPQDFTNHSSGLMDIASYLPYVAMAGMGGLAALPAAAGATGPAMGATAGAGTTFGGAAPAIGATGLGTSLGGGYAGAGAVGTAPSTAAIGGDLATGIPASTGLQSTGSLGLQGPAFSGGTVQGTGLGLSTTGAGGTAASTASTAANSSGGFGAFLDSMFGGGIAAAGTAGGITATGSLFRDLLGGGLDLYSANQRENAAEQAARLADPFASQRPQYQEDLAALMADPSSINQDPAYQFRRDSGQAALERSLSARGYLNSGNLMTELTKYGGEAASEELDKQRRFLAELSGAGFGPGTAGSNYMQGQQGSLAQRYQGMSQLGTLAGRGLSNLFGNNDNSQYRLV